MLKKAQRINPFILADISSNITSLSTAATALHSLRTERFKGTGFKDAKEPTTVTKMGYTKSHEVLPTLTRHRFWLQSVTTFYKLPFVGIISVLRTEKVIKNVLRRTTLNVLL